ncbi:uncharacterized protein LOC123016481 [Tribolium madens]|uniref:uncharacterized protein LOC123016481 n=1 Tax=Tribolium madens TaxID=41895 RepID=UPI001CF75A2B|nr:uncharacterized protein LOC123016481 [Tribolium madens]
MNEIPELKDDLAFLKKFDSRGKIWQDIDANNSKGKAKVRSNFLLHPRRFSSESECSSTLQTPRKFLSGTVLKTLETHEENNNVKKRFDYNTKSNMGTSIDSRIETDIGDRNSPILSNTKTTTILKKQTVRPASVRVENFDKKFKILVERSLKFLTSIRVLFEEGISPPDGEEDCMRRFKRLQEFTSRFSRIYLYPLLRHMDELSLPEKLGTVIINQKLLSAQQVILQGLQAYHTHLPGSIGKCGSDKLKSLLEQTLYLCQIYDLLKKDTNLETSEFINAMRSHVELLLETLRNFDLKFIEKKSNESIKKKPKAQCTKPKSKLSMYATNASFRKDLELKKALQTLAKKKFSVKSRYKTATFKHRPPVERPRGTEEQGKMKLFCKHSGNLKSTPMRSPIREDDIKTMVEIDSELEVPPNTGENLNHENSIASSRHQLVQDSDRDGIEVEKALDVLKRFLGNSEEAQNDFLKKIATQVEREKSDKSKKKLEPVVTVTGAKNAKLICIRDDNSVVEDDCKRDKEIMTDAEIKLTSSETQTEIEEIKKVQSKSVVKISRLPKVNRMLQLLPKECAISIIQYKLQYSQFRKHDPMYRKSAHIQPWILMGRISDDLLDCILKSVTGELEVNEILENLYNAEFQY